MRIKDLFTMAFMNLWRRKLRTFLTVLGVVIGCTSIIVMVSFGLAQKKQLEELTGSSSSFQSITVYSSTFGGKSDGKRPKKGSITDKTIKEFEAMDNVDSVVYSSTLDPQKQGSLVEFSEYNFMGSVGGFDHKSLENAEIKLTEGRMFNPGSNSKDIEVIVSSMAGYMMNPKNLSDIDSYDPTKINLLAKTAILTIGDVSASGAMGGLAALGGQGQGTSQTPIKGKEKYRIKVVGVFEGDMFGSKPNIITSKETIDRLNEEINKMAGVTKATKDKSYESVQINVKDSQRLEDTKKVLDDLGYETFSNSEMVESINKTTAVMQAILGGIGGISLFVAAIGITNSMVMSVYERTKEIGVMKVIGAKIGDIRNLFLLEAGMMGLLGGLVGVILSLITSSILNNIFSRVASSPDQVISIITPTLALGALFICFAIGVITGYYPAVRATKLSALEAIRTE